LAGFGFARRGLFLPDYQAVFVQGYAILCFVVLVISIVMVIWRFKKRSFGAYALRVLGTLTLLGLLVGLLLPAVPSAREAAKRMACAVNLRTLGQSSELGDRLSKGRVVCMSKRA
jgi:hypothetical protein